MKRASTVLLAAAMLFVISTQSRSALPALFYEICKGEGGDNRCDGKPHHIGCKDSEVGYAEHVCLVQDGGGKTHVRKHTETLIENVPGGQCGYYRWKAVCESEP